MAEEPLKLEVTGLIAKIQEDINEQDLVKLPVPLKIEVDPKKTTSKTAIADAYLAGYELGFRDGKAGVEPAPEKKDEGLIVEPMRITLPWWP